MKPLKYVILVAAVVILSSATMLVMAAYQRHEARKITMEYVYNICNASRLAIDGQAEKDCGEVQDRTDTEFLCAERNGDPSNKCWVEDKRK